MSCQIFGPTKSSTGGAIFIESSPENEAFFIKFVKQSGWNEETSKGIFVDGENFRLKFGMSEAAGIIRAVQTNGEWNFFHTFDESKSSGRFSFYSKTYTDAKGVERTKEGFGFSAKKGEIEVKVGVSTSDAQMIALYLTNALNKMFDLNMAEDKRKQQEYFDKVRQGQAADSPKKTKENKGEPTPAENDPPF